MSSSLIAFIAVVVFVVGWFAIGTQYNVRKGHEAMRWLQDGLSLIGEKTTLRWLGSSVVELKIQQAEAPFSRADVLIVLEPRDVSIIWLFARFRRRRDLFIFRATLRRTPQLELEAFDPSAWSAHGVERKLKAEQWTPFSAPPPLLGYARPSSAGAAELIASSKVDGCPLVRLAVHRSAPNLELQWPLDQLRQRPAHDIFEIVRGIAERI
jgi:hypothetical protein